MKKLLFVIFIAVLVIPLNALGMLRIESIKELPETHMNLEVRDADGKFAPVLIVKTELKGLGFLNVSRPTKHAAEYSDGKHEYKFYMNDNQRVVEITHSEYEPLEVRLLADYNIDVKAQRVYEMMLTNVPEKEFINVVIISDPADTEKIIDGKNLGTGQSFKLYIGKHTLKVQKEGYRSKTQTITVSESSTLFNDIKLEEIDILAVQISSVPQGATIYIDNQGQGITDKGIFKYPGTYELKLTKTDYLDINKQITIAENKLNIFNYNLTKNSGIINFSITPADAILKLNGEIYKDYRLELIPGKYNVEISKSGYLSKSDVINLKLGEKINKQFILQKNVGILKLSITPSDAVIQINKTTYRKTTNIELAPGKYKIEVQKQGYFPQSELIDIELNKTISRTFSLRQIKGKLQFNITPLTAKIEMKKDGLIYQEWTGMKILKDIPVGEYEIIASLTGYESKTKKCTIELDKTAQLNITLEKAVSKPSFDSAQDVNMIFVKGGTFKMGDTHWDGLGYSNEKSVHKLYVSDFYIGKYEVTHKEYIKFLNNIGVSSNGSFGGETYIDMDAEGCAIGYSNGRFYFKGSEYADYEDCPVIEVTWYGSKAYCEWKGGRLPTEAEWEYASRGGNKSRDYKYSGSKKNIDEVAWYQANSKNKTHPVGQKKSNELGIYDMSGNVLEWCGDWYGKTFYYATYFSKKENCKGPDNGRYRVLRGGSWKSSNVQCRVSYRGHNFPGNRNNKSGFRFVRTP